MEYLDLVLDKLPASIRNDQSTLVTLGFTALCIILTLSKYDLLVDLIALLIVIIFILVHSIIHIPISG